MAGVIHQESTLGQIFLYQGITKGVHATKAHKSDQLWFQ